MGIRDFYPTVNNAGAVTEITLNDLKGSKIAIDISTMVYNWYCVGNCSAVAATASASAAASPNAPNLPNHVIGRDNRVINHVLGLYHRTLFLLASDIQPIYVFDGSPPASKHQTIAKRKEKVTVRPPASAFEECKELLTAMGVPWFVAIGEGEAAAAELYKRNLINYVSTDDSDTVVFGAPIVRGLVPSAQKTTKMQLYHPDTVCEKLSMTMNELRLWSCLVGCDHIERTFGPKTALKAIASAKNTIVAMTVPSVSTTVSSVLTVPSVPPPTVTELVFKGVKPIMYEKIITTMAYFANTTASVPELVNGRRIEELIAVRIVLSTRFFDLFRDKYGVSEDRLKSRNWVEYTRMYGGTAC